MTKETESRNQTWVTVSHPGYLGKKKDEFLASWDKEYGQGGWRLVWETAQGEILDYDGIFQKYVESYALYFLLHPEEAEYLTQNFAYAYDKELVAKEEAFDPHFLFENPGHPNQFHNVALNLALEVVLEMPFRGESPIQVREGKPGTDEATWPAGWRWSPGRIPAPNPEDIPSEESLGWWQPGSIEHFYQSTKVLQIKK